MNQEKNFKHLVHCMMYELIGILIDNIYIDNMSTVGNDNNNILIFKMTYHYIIVIHIHIINLISYHIILLV